MSRTKAYLYLCCILGVIVVLLTGLSNWSAHFAPPPILLANLGEQQPQQTQQTSAPIPQPPYTPAIQAQLAASHGFQYLVSYTDTGFSPATLSVSAGQTVRFTNNSHGDLWLTTTGTSPYPPGDNGCGQSALDSCQPLTPGAFWEFTFTTAGTWMYTDDLHANNIGTITVSAQ